MKPVLGGLVLALIIVAALAAAQQPPRPAPGQKPAAPAPALRIVVVEGEDAVNIVQQKTAVRPLVEVRDRNNLPVAGATVQFALVNVGGASTGAFANGQTAVTVVTDVAGRAAAPQLQAIGNGALRINVQATFQGQVATATINQTNFATVAQATQAGRTPTSSSSASAGGGGAGGAATGGIAGTIAGIAAAATSGLVVAKQTTDSSCTAAHSTFVTDLSAAQDACIGNSSSPQCTTAGTQASSSLGEWCSCDGAANVDASLQAIGTSLAELSGIAGLSGVGFPASCRQ